MVFQQSDAVRFANENRENKIKIGAIFPHGVVKTAGRLLKILMYTHL